MVDKITNRWDPENVFKKIIEGKIPAKVVAEDDRCIAIEDINPKADVHILVIPKLDCSDFSDFVKKSNGDTAYFWDFVQSVIENQELTSYKLIANTGIESGQCVFHFHLHIMSNTST